MRSFFFLRYGRIAAVSSPATMNIPLTAPQTSRSLPMPPPKDDEMESAVFSSKPVRSEKASKTAWAQL